MLIHLLTNSYFILIIQRDHKKRQSFNVNMKKEEIIDHEKIKLSNEKGPLQKVSLISSIFYGICVIGGVLLLYPSFIDGSFFRALGNFINLPEYSQTILTVFFSGIMSFIASLLVHKSKTVGVYLLAVSTLLWVLILMFTIYEDGFNLFTLMLILTALAFLILIHYFWGKRR